MPLPLFPPGPRAVTGRATARDAAAVLCGLGYALPPRVVTNEELAARLAITPEWIRGRTGIAERRIAPPGTTTGDLAAEAGARALKSAGGGEVQALVLATTTPDRPCPATAPEVATRLGLTGIAAFDVAAVCTGFLYALATAAGFIAARLADRVLVIGAETFSTLLDPADPDTAPIFGDGAGAVVLRRGRPDEPGALGRVLLGSDGEWRDLITVPGGAAEPEPEAEADGGAAARGPAAGAGGGGAADGARAGGDGADGAGGGGATDGAGGGGATGGAGGGGAMGGAGAGGAADGAGAGRGAGPGYFRMRGREVFRHAVRRMTEAATAAAQDAGWRLDQVDRLVAHQANARITAFVGTELGIPADRRAGNIERVGNTAAASLPILLAQAAEDGFLAPGHRVLLTAFGGGLTWGATTLTWPEPSP